MLGNIWKAYNSSPWQNNFINGIQIHNQSPWFKPMTIHSSKTQFSLAISNPNSHWQHQTPILIGKHQNPILIDNIKAQFSLALLYQKEKSPRLSNAWQRKKIYHVTVAKKKDHGNHLMKKLIESYLEDYVLIL